MTDARLDECVAIVTGAAGGQGAAEARLLVERGARVVVADVDDAAGAALAGELGDHAIYRHLDVRSEAEWTAALDAATTAFGRVNALVNNAGHQPAAEVDHQDVGRRVPAGDRRQPGRRVHRHPRGRARDHRRGRRQHRERVVGERLRRRVGHRGLRVVEVRAPRPDPRRRDRARRARASG